MSTSENSSNPSLGNVNEGSRIAPKPTLTENDRVHPAPQVRSATPPLISNVYTGAAAPMPTAKQPSQLAVDALNALLSNVPKDYHVEALREALNGVIDRMAKSEQVEAVNLITTDLHRIANKY